MLYSIVDISWAAGFFEGEGTVGPRSVGISQTEEWPLKKLVTLFGGNIWLAYEAKGNSKKCWQWWICGQEGRNFVSLIFPLLSPRRQAQIEAKFLTDEKLASRKIISRKILSEKMKLNPRQRDELGRFSNA